MHANTFRRAPLAGGPVRRARGNGEAGEERRVNTTSALLVALALLGVVVTIAFGFWMIDAIQPPA